MKKLFCFGYGYCCDHLARMLTEINKTITNEEDKWSIAGTTRDREKYENMKSQDIKAYILDEEKFLVDPASALKGVTHILLSIPPGDEGGPAYVAHARDLLGIETLQWVGYLSTIGVYGDRNGAEVDEDSEISPTSKRGSRRVRAEKQWMRLFTDHNLPLHIFRLSGIYGPGRCALDSIRAGLARRIDKPGHAFNRIHVEDIAQTLYASMISPAPGEIYNLADDLPAPSHEVINYACELLNVDPPPLIPFEEADMAPMARSFYKDNKRIINTKIKEKLGITLKYPDYKAGLKGCL